MALYKHAQFLGISQHKVFDAMNGPGAAAPYSGIYRCETCGNEIASNAGDALPPENHHQHNPGEGPIRWRLVVFAKTKQA